MHTWKVWTVGFISALVLAGCGAPPTGTANPTTGAGNSTVNDSAANMSGASGTGTQTDNSTASIPPANTKPLPDQKTITYTAEGDPQSVPARLFRSTQGYYMYVTDKYTPNAVEPGVDGLEFKLNSNASIQISMLPKASFDLDKALSDAKAYVQATNTPSVETGGSGTTDTLWRNGIQLLATVHASNATETVVYWLLTIDGVPFKIVNHLPKEWESMNEEFAMINTIGILNAQ